MMDRPADITMTLPLPPSTNRTERSTVMGGRAVRYSTAEYKNWADVAGYAACSQAHGDSVPYRYHMRITLPEQRIDPDNRIKPTQDMLQKCGVIANDRHLRRLVVEVDATRTSDTMVVELWATDEQPKKSRAKKP